MRSPWRPPCVSLASLFRKRSNSVNLPGGSAGSIETARSCDVHLSVDPVHGRHEGDGDESHDDPDEEDHGRLEQAREVLELVVELPVEVVGGAVELVVEGPRALADEEHPTGRDREEVGLGQRGRPAPSPRSMPSRAVLRPRRKTALVVAFPVTRSASGSGTPAADHRAQDPAEPLQNRGTDHVTEHRDVQDESRP